MKTAKAQLKRYRQSVLKHAFEGKLTEEWRDNNNRIKNEKFKNSFVKEDPKLSEKEYLPKNWFWSHLEDIIEENRFGLVRSRKEQNKSGDGYPYIRMDNIKNEGGLDLSKINYVQADTEEVTKYRLEGGDILFNTRNSYELVGKSAIVNEAQKTRLFNNNILRLRICEGINPKFIACQLSSPFYKNQIMEKKKATTNICALYAKDILPSFIKLTTLEEQNKIVRIIDKKFSSIEKLNESIKMDIDKGVLIRQSILKKAFEGKLLGN